MSFWVLTWAVIVMLPDGGDVETFNTRARFESEALCQKEVSLTEPRMPDVMRGHYNVPFSIEVEVKGFCSADGTPS